MNDSSEQVLITGAGLISPLGLTREQTWEAVRQGRCGMGRLSAMECPLPEGAEGGQAPPLECDFAPDLPRETRYLRRALLDALRDAGLEQEIPYPRARCGIVLGTTLHGMRCAGRFLRGNDSVVLKDFLAGAVLQNAAGDLGWTGCSLTTCSACSSSLGSIAMAVTMLRTGQLDLVVAGGYDTISEYVYAGFNSLRLVASGRLRPFARGREGMKLAEGYGIVVLERAADARRRGARGLATVLGFGESADAHHLTQPHPQGEGAARAISAALKDAGLDADDVDLVAAHATGTPDNDAAEAAALSAVFGSKLSHVPVVAFKSHLGHALGGAGAVELILSAMALRDQVIPACANVRAEDVEFANLKVTTGQSRAGRLRAALNTSLGFGGANTCVILGQAPATKPGAERSAAPDSFQGEKTIRGFAPLRDRLDHADVFITGIGVVFPGAVGNEAFVHRLSQKADPLEADLGAVAEAEIAPLLAARRVRRMSEYVKLSLAAAVLCLRHAGIDDVNEFCQPCAAVLGTTHGSTTYSEAYYRQIVRDGIGAANPMLFAEGVPNAGAAHLSLMLSLKGPCQTVIGTRTAGLDALRLAWMRIACGQWKRAIVGAAEEYAPLVNAAYGPWGLYRGGTGGAGFVAGAGAVTLVLESRASMESRRGRSFGRIVAAAGSAAPLRAMPRLARSVLRDLGQPASVIGSGNGTWIDGVEATAVAGDAPPSVYPFTGECFSALPLAGIASALLRPSLARESDGRFAVLATDYAGGVSGVAIECRA